jgi:hypothetical protein
VGLLHTTCIRIDKQRLITRRAQSDINGRKERK